MNNLIKVLNPDKLTELKANGFNTYMLEKLNGRDTYVFTMSTELIAYLSNHFEKSDYIFCNKLCFQFFKE